MARGKPFAKHHKVGVGRNDSGRIVGSGVYFYRLTAEKRVEARKTILLW